VTGTSKYRVIKIRIRSEYLQNISKFDNSHVILHSEGSTIYMDYNESEIYTEARTYTVQCAVKAARPYAVSDSAWHHSKCYLNNTVKRSMDEGKSSYISCS
jgi:hypothetical protein